MLGRIVMFGFYYTMLCCPILYYTILYYTILYYTIPYYTILYHTIPYYTILYHTIQNILYDTLLKKPDRWQQSRKSWVHSQALAFSTRPDPQVALHCKKRLYNTIQYSIP